MSQMIYSIGLRRIQSLSNSINRLQINQSTRNFSVGCCSIENVITDRTKSIPNNPISVPHRGIYTKNALGLARYALVRKNKLEAYRDNKDRYIERLAEYLENDTQSILRDDVTNLVGLAENEQHLDILERAVTSSNFRDDFEDSGLGSAVMRLYYTLDMVDRAYNNLKDTERFGKFFKQYTAHKIVATMLYNAGRYEQVVEVYHLACANLSRPEGREKVFPGLAVLAFAALAKMNTPEAFEKAEQLYNEITLREYSFYIQHRIITFIGYTALMQGHPARALNLISNAVDRNQLTIRELKTVALSQLNRWEDVLYHLRAAISRRSEKGFSIPTKSSLILAETLESLKMKLVEIEDVSARDSLAAVLDELKGSPLIGNSSLDSLVFAKIEGIGYNDYAAVRKQEDMDRQRPYAPKPNYNRGQDRFDGDSGFGDRARNYDDSRSFQPRNQQGGNYGHRRGGRQQRGQSKSYFEDDMGNGEFDNDAIYTQRKFK